MIIRTPGSQRFIEIDLLRGLLIMLMIFGHILWDLDRFGMVPMNSGIYVALQRTVPPLFFILVGISLIVSKRKIENKTVEEEKEYYKRLIVRGLRIFSLGMILTILSLIVMPENPVLFGVLHCIGLSIVLSVPFLKYRLYSPLFGLIIIFAGSIISQLHVNNPTIFHLSIGFHQTDVWRYTVDYFPLLPWFGFCLMGLFVGDCLYCGDKRRFRMPDLSKYRPAKAFQWIGQHSLIIYLVHQPIIAGVLTAYMRL